VRELFALLDRHKLADNTLVIFVGDNGMPFPRAKGTLYDPGIRVPFLAHLPGRSKPGMVRRELISHTDFAPTFLELAGAPVPAKVQGRSFLPLLTGGSYTPHEAVFSERNWHDNFDPIRSIRTGRHKLIFNAAPNFPYRPALDIADGLSWKSLLAMAGRRPMKPEHRLMFEPNRPVLELYDLEQDPNEFHNLASSSAHQDLLEDLKSRLGRWMEATYDYLPPSSERSESLSRTWPLTL
jgi:N-sulfoglucosamine sulfohydrolase